MFSWLKELTLVGYYTSEIGASQELRYVHVAGRYDGDMPYEEGDRAYS
ncbi:MAG: gluconate 2-dehydrogenase subunit 3 family protein [Gemmatimonadota bacterium]|nr:gluconate 2-dehydrogenase subunit 3 family protein [Gemmatimonadota bacterium]